MLCAEITFDEEEWHNTNLTIQFNIFINQDVKLWVQYDLSFVNTF